LRKEKTLPICRLYKNCNSQIENIFIVFYITSQLIYLLRKEKTLPICRLYKNCNSQIENIFKNWQKNNNVTGVTEDVLLVYLHQLSDKFSPNSLWSKWSMLKSCLEIKETAEVRRFVFLLQTLSKK
jgi:hypothetical protein